MAVYTCDVHFRLSDNSSGIRTCTHGVWTGTIPVCITAPSTTTTSMYIWIAFALIFFVAIVMLGLFLRKRCALPGSMFVSVAYDRTGSSPTVIGNAIDLQPTPKTDPQSKPQPELQPEPQHPQLSGPLGVVSSTETLNMPTVSLQLGRCLGRGSSGEVFEALWDRRHVAVKRIPLDVTGQDAVLAEFRDELGMLKRCQHINIIQVFGYSMNPLWIIMELCEESLYHRLHGQELRQKERLLDERRVLSDAAAGLVYLHSIEIVHRDLKSLNVLIANGSGVAKLADFGLARVRNHTQNFTGGVARGTLQYMAPEMLQLEPQYSSKSDIYAFAILAWEVATRKKPYEGVDPSILMNLVQEGKRVNIEEVRDLAFRQLIPQAWAPPSRSAGCHPAPLGAG